jgi:hypothetical protein
MGAPPVIKNCLNCTAEYRAKATHAETRSKFCSHACKGAFKTKSATVEKCCGHCKKLFTTLPGLDATYCSVPCTRKGVGNTKRTWYKNAQGYVVGGFTIDGKSRGILQHRYVMEQHLKRPLFDYETVHHVNGVRDDNRLENLEVWIVRPHKGQRVQDTVDWAVKFLAEHGFRVEKIDQ